MNPPLSAKERFDIARAIVEHEDGLINSRITWLQVFQGLLFTAFFSALKLLAEEGSTPAREWKTVVSALMVLLPALGMLSSLAGYLSVRSATTHLKAIDDMLLVFLVTWLVFLVLPWRIH